MKEIRGLIGQTYQTSHDMHEVVMQTAEPVSTRDATERLVKILDITYVKADLEYVAAKATKMNSEERTQLLRLLK